MKKLLFGLFLLACFSLPLCADINMNEVNSKDEGISEKKTISEKMPPISIEQAQVIVKKEINKNYIKKDSSYVVQMEDKTNTILSKQYAHYLKSDPHAQAVINNNSSLIQNYINQKFDNKLIELNKKNEEKNRPYIIGSLGSFIFSSCIYLMSSRNSSSHEKHINPLSILSSIALPISAAAVGYFFRKKDSAIELHKVRINEMKKITNEQFGKTRQQSKKNQNSSKAIQQTESSTDGNHTHEKCNF